MLRAGKASRQTQRLWVQGQGWADVRVGRKDRAEGLGGREANRTEQDRKPRRAVPRWCTFLPGASGCQDGPDRPSQQRGRPQLLGGAGWAPHRDRPAWQCPGLWGGQLLQAETVWTSILGQRQGKQKGRPGAAVRAV